MTTKEELFNQYLGKWPQMTVKGKTISRKRAREIIIRCINPFYIFSNNREHREEIIKILQIPNEPKSRSEYNSEEDYSENFSKDFRKYWQRFLKNKKRLKILDLNFICLTSILNSDDFMVCPYGWLSWDGEIEFIGNIGKWPDIEEVFKEWKIIAKNFPYLEMEIQLWNNDIYCDYNSIPDNYVIKPIIQFNLKNGKCIFTKPEYNHNIKVVENTFNFKKASEKELKEYFDKRQQILKGYMTETIKNLKLGVKEIEKKFSK